jgi:hypothetical protein
VYEPCLAVAAAVAPRRWDVAVEYIPEDDGVDPPMPESPKEEEEQEEGGEQHEKQD